MVFRFGICPGVFGGRRVDGGSIRRIAFWAAAILGVEQRGVGGEIRRIRLWNRRLGLGEESTTRRSVEGELKLYIFEKIEELGKKCRKKERFSGAARSVRVGATVDRGEEKRGASGEKRRTKAENKKTREPETGRELLVKLSE